MMVKVIRGDEITRERMYSENRGGPKIKTFWTISIQWADRAEGSGKFGAYPGLYVLGTVGLNEKPQHGSPNLSFLELSKTFFVAYMIEDLNNF